MWQFLIKTKWGSSLKSAGCKPNLFIYTIKPKFLTFWELALYDLNSHNFSYWKYLKYKKLIKKLSLRGNVSNILSKTNCLSLRGKKKFKNTLHKNPRTCASSLPKTWISLSISMFTVTVVSTIANPQLCASKSCFR